MNKNILNSHVAKNCHVFDEEAILKKIRWRNLVAFWILGLCNNYGYVVMLSAAHDILQSKFGEQNDTSSNDTNDMNATYTGNRTCNTISTGAILLADILPSLAIKIMGPFLPFLVQIPHGVVEYC